MPLESLPELRHVVWLHRHAAPVGGCEQYMLRTARHLRARGIRSSLLYELDGSFAPDYARELAGHGGLAGGVFPQVELARQLAELRPDIVFVQNCDDARTLRTLAAGPAPALRFFHDHRLFCLREHKYTTLGHSTCTRTAGLGCYACLGFLGRSERWPGVELRTLGALRRQQSAHHGLDGFVVGSDYMARHVAQHGFDSRRIHTAPLYATVDDILADEPESLPVARDDSLIVFAGQLVRGKGVDILLDSLPQLRSRARLVIAGEGAQGDELRRQARATGWGERIEFVGRLDPSRLAELMRHACCVVMPSRSPETFGQSGLEAQALGTAVVASDVGGISQWLVHETTGLLVRPNDSAGLADALDRLLGAPAWARRLGRAGQNRCRMMFTPDQHVDRLLAAFQRCRLRRQLEHDERVQDEHTQHAGRETASGDERRPTPDRPLSPPIPVNSPLPEALETSQ